MRISYSNRAHKPASVGALSTLATKVLVLYNFLHRSKENLLKLLLPPWVVVQLRAP